MSPKTAPQVQLETILENNRSEATRLLQENTRIEAEMTRILSEPPPPMSRLVEAFVKGHSEPPAPESTKLSAEKEVLFAALAIVRSWSRRHKKNWKTQERELAKAVERLTWEK